MSKLQNYIRTLNVYQQRHPFLAFGHGVIKKYAEDEAGYQAALLTYYAFLSLFPLLLVLTTLTERFAGRYPHLEAKIISGTTSYFPLLGNQLASHVHGLRSSGLALAAGVLFTLYGTRGLAAAFRRGIQHMWHVPRNERTGFPRSMVDNLIIICVGGAGFILASLSAGLAGAVGHGWAFRVLASALNACVLFGVFTFLIRLSVAKHARGQEIRLAAAGAAIGLVILQTAGSYLLARELRGLDALYSYFAVALGLLFWIYLQAQIMYYAVTIGIVGSQKLWPRSLEAAFPTKVDKQMSSPKDDH